MARALSKLGYCSRSTAAQLIRSGRVALGGEIRRDPETPVSGKLDQIRVDGKLIEAQKKVYLMMNKPRGVVTTASDEKGRDTVYATLNSSPGATRIGRVKDCRGLLPSVAWTERVKVCCS